MTESSLVGKSSFILNPHLLIITEQSSRGVLLGHFLFLKRLNEP